MDRFVCIHAHFYQPPRENPWLEAIESQPSARPYHDWNERITAECYAPNGASRLLNDKGRIIEIVNNYSRISFNFGPTLLSWLEEKSPGVYASLLEADRLSAERFAGHGSAIAQAYNHMILPLANRADKQTQIAWGIRDFEHRFGRMPEGMWLPETAVDNETLELLADHGIQFTILAPSQAGKVRAPRGRWKDVSGARIDPTRAYQARLANGRRIALFFYDGPISRAVAFEKLLNSGEQFAQRLLSGFSAERNWPQLMHIATDGESYGHHHAHGDMALASALKHIEDSGFARLTNYGEYLAQHRSEHEVQIIERTAWSCAHGVERWSADCGCNTGSDLRQHWRGPLRASLDWLRDTINAISGPILDDLFNDPAAARDGYINVVLDRSERSVERFLYDHATRWFTADERVTALRLMEMQRHLMLMYTSCGWFFDEISGIETVKVIEYAGRVIQLAQQLFPDESLEEQFLERLSFASSNFPEHKNGAEIYRKQVRPAIKELEDVAAHFAISSLFERKGEVPIFCYRIDKKEVVPAKQGTARMITGRADVQSLITLEHKALMLAAIHRGDTNLLAGVKPFPGEDEYAAMRDELEAEFESAENSEAVSLLERRFPGHIYTLASLFSDERQRILELLLRKTMAKTEAAYRKLYESQSALARVLSAHGIEKPTIMHITAEFIVNTDLERELEKLPLDAARLHSLLHQAEEGQIALDKASLGYRLQRTIDRAMDEFGDHPDDHERLRQASQAVQLAASLKLPVNLWHAQNVFYEVARRDLAAQRQSHQWLVSFLTLGEKLGIETGQFEIGKAPPLAA